MKRTGHLIEKIADSDNLRLAFWKARKGKSHAIAVEKYRKNLDENLMILRQQIISGEVQVGDYRFFKIYEPKEREICASAFSEQVLHHALMNICHDYFEKKQIFDSYASRKGKGTYAALDRAKKYTRKYPWFLKLDMQKFFASIHHHVLKQQLEALFKDPILLQIFYAIINSYPTENERGLPIGNLTSQYFANHYLCGLDHFIKEKLFCRAYVRYMDDLIIWHFDKKALKNIYAEIRYFVENELLLSLKPVLLNKTENGLPFLGYLLFPHYTRLKQQSKQRFIKKWRIIEWHYHKGYWSEQKCQRKVLPLLAFTQKADSKKFREKVLDLFGGS